MRDHPRRFDGRDVMMKWDQLILGAAVGAIFAWVASYFAFVGTDQGETPQAQSARPEGDTTHLRIQTHLGPETSRGRLVQRFVDQVQEMSGGGIAIEMSYASSKSPSEEVYSAVLNGLLDCDMTSPTYQIARNPAFQFVGDIQGGYTSPYEQLSWLYVSDGMEEARKLYNAYGLEIVGWAIPATESFSSLTPIGGIAEIQGWRFRSPPGLEAEIFEALGANPIVMAYEDGYQSLKTGLLDGMDASNIANNFALGLYDIAKYATFPGFHSQPTDHLACRKDVWDQMPEAHKEILSVAMEALALQTGLLTETQNLQIAATLRKRGVTLQRWSDEDIRTYRRAAQSVWPHVATTPEARRLVSSHQEHLKRLGLL